LKVIWEKDLAVDSPVPWYLPLDKNHFSLSSFRLTAVGRFVTRNLVRKTRQRWKITVFSIVTKEFWGKTSHFAKIDFTDLPLCLENNLSKAQNMNFLILA